MRYLLMIIVLSFINFTSLAASSFKVTSLSTKMSEKLAQINFWQDTCPVPLSRLKMVEFSYIDFAKKSQHDGQIIVLDAVAPATLAIFKELYTKKFPIQRATALWDKPISDDELVALNNTSSFYCRPISGGSIFSLHSYGVAIDINPLQNPYVAFTESNGTAKISPVAGWQYLNRNNLRHGMVEPIVNIFKKNGFSIWGGTWNTPIDWQHFQLSRSLAQLLVAMSSQDATVFFKSYTASQATFFDKLDARDKSFIDLYNKNPQKFMQLFAERPDIFKQPLKTALKYLDKNK